MNEEIIQLTQSDGHLFAVHVLGDNTVVRNRVIMVALTGAGAIFPLEFNRDCGMDRGPAFLAHWPKPYLVGYEDDRDPRITDEEWVALSKRGR